MSDRPDIAAALAPGEQLLWQGAPKRGRPTPLRATLIASLLYLATLILLLVAWYVEVFHGQNAEMHLVSYGLVGSAAFATFLGLRLSLLDRRRARARDARTAYGITDKRALALAGPYESAVPLTPGLTAEAKGSTLTITGPGGQLRFERLTDAAEARKILLQQIGDPA